MITRYYDLARNNHVVWDEAHFGKFGAYYITRQYFTDVHPPLGKMLVAAGEWLTGFDGAFKFDSGKEYPPEVDFKHMRMINTTFGVMLVPLAFMTARNFNFSKPACLLTAVLVLCENATITISRFILLDAILLFFTALSFYALSGFHRHQCHPFTPAWWGWLSFTGLALGCVLSVKWVGLFAVATVGVYTLQDLWEKYDAKDMSRGTYMTHWAARALCLILIPSMVYMAAFKVHFTILNHEGPDSKNMDTEFQAHLIGNKRSNTPRDVAFLSSITLKNVNMPKIYLHSHHDKYETGSKQQQVTGYPHADSNNMWNILKPHGQSNYKTVAEFIKDKMTVRLNHNLSNRNLHSHDAPAPVSFTGSKVCHHCKEVSGYGNQTSGDIYDHWRIHIVNQISTRNESQLDDDQRLHVFSTQFALENVEVGCYLMLTGEQLPKWGFHQHEIACAKDHKITDPAVLWTIEMHKSELVAPAPDGTYNSHFFRDFWYLNKLMWRTNNALVPNPEKFDLLSSKPEDWPFQSKLLRLCGWDAKSVKFMLLGNPFIWQTGTLSVIAFVIATIVYAIRDRRHTFNQSLDHWNARFPVGRMIFSGYILHYFPFYLMSRVMYMHHYFPSLYFSMFMYPFMLDHALFLTPLRRRRAIFGIVTAIVVLGYIYFAPFTYGAVGDVKEYAGRNWRDAWKITREF
ncbi:glycosyltransferase family 39 protein [Gongronella butleri]|nr:glycosyltransferase family 39 protein [Gongronella butleri]